MAATKSRGKKSNTTTNDPRLYGTGFSPVDRMIIPPKPGPATANTSSSVVGRAAYGLLGLLGVKKPSLLQESYEEKAWAWPSEAQSFLSQTNNNDTRHKVYYSPKLMHLKIRVLSAQNLVAVEKGRSLAPTIAKIQLSGQIRRTRPQGSANPAWNEEFMLVASEPLEDPLVVTVEEKVAAGHDEPIGRVVIPVESPYVPRNDLSKSVPSMWFSLSHGTKVVDDRGESSKTLASKIHLRLSLETAYHVLDESMNYTSEMLKKNMYDAYG